MRIIAIATLAAATLTFGAPAAAQFQKPEDAIKYRQSALYVMGTHFGRIGAMVQGKVPYDPKAAIQNAEIVQEMAHLPWVGFGPGYEKGAPTKAKPAIWTEPAKFKEREEKLLPVLEKLTAAAKTEDLGKLKTAFGNTAETCKACHDNYRNK